MFWYSEVRLYGRDVGGGIAEGLVRERMVSGRNAGLAMAIVVTLVLVDIVIMLLSLPPYTSSSPGARRQHGWV
jgi:hypothetical protein